AEVFYRLGRVSASAGPLFESLAAILLASILVFARGWDLSFAALTAYILMLYRLQPRARDLASSRVALLGFRGSVTEVRSLLDLAGEAEAPSGGTPFLGVAESIRFDQVGFCYPTRADPALRSISLE